MVGHSTWVELPSSIPASKGRAYGFGTSRPFG